MATAQMRSPQNGSTGVDPAHRRVILASSLGTVFEWYDFYLYGALSIIISKQFFSGVNETTGFIFALLAFAAGFFVRPFGALVFGRLGDLVGRKRTFLITIVLMGVSTALVGLLPSYATIGVAAPIILIVLRLAQGLALGGEYGGAAVYVAEHAPDGRRGLYTSWIQTTATMGLFLSLLVILLCRWATGDDFEVWGWRIPFLVSVVLLAISVYIRLQLIGTPFFVVFGALSDRIGRKKIIMTGCLLAALTYFPTFKAITHYANPALERAVATAPVVVVADPARCSLQFDPVGKAAFRESCDVAKTALARAGVPYKNEAVPAGTSAVVRIGTGATAVTVPAFEGAGLDTAAFKAATTDFGKQLRGALDTAGYPPKADMSQVNYPMVIALCAWLVILVTLVYGPIAAWLVELFPTRIRYTSMSLPYHLGNGWFGGFLPVTSFAIVAATGDIYAGLWYPIVVALMTLVIGGLFLRETHRSPLPE